MPRQPPRARKRPPRQLLVEFGDNCRHIRTFTKPGTDVAYMDDYIFATPTVAYRMTYAGVAPQWDWDAALSDHAPLIAEFAVLTE